MVSIMSEAEGAMDELGFAIAKGSEAECGLDI